MRQVALFVAASAVVACASAARPPEGPTPGGAQPSPTASTNMPPPEAPLNEEERALTEHLDADRKLLTDLGERQLGSPLGLAAATDAIALQLEKLGYEARRMGFVVGEVPTMNVEAVVAGGRRGRENIVIGAHYDTLAGDAGDYDNASGAAVLMALARHFAERRPERTVRLVWFANDASSTATSSAARSGAARSGAATADAKHGSDVYAERARIEGLEITLMLSLDSLGGATSKAGLRVVGPQRFEQHREFVAAELSRDGLLEITPLSFDKPEATLSSSHLAFDRFGYPALLVTDAEGAARQVDAERLARLSAALIRVVDTLASPSLSSQ